MATKRLRPSGTWEYIIRRSKLLPKPLSLTFQSEEEGDAYVARLEQLLDAGIMPADVVEQREMISTTLGAIREYLRRVSVPDSDSQVLNTLLSRLPSKALTMVGYEWAERWVSGMKRELHLSPSTIRHNVGALARCFDWVVKSGRPMLAVNPLRLLPKRYATYTDDDRAAVEAQDVAAKDDVHRNRRPSAAEEAEIRRIMSGGKPECVSGPLSCRIGRHWCFCSSWRSSPRCGCAKCIRWRFRSSTSAVARPRSNEQRTVVSARCLSRLLRSERSSATSRL